MWENYSWLQMIKPIRCSLVRFQLPNVTMFLRLVRIEIGPIDTLNPANVLRKSQYPAYVWQLKSHLYAWYALSMSTGREHEHDPWFLIRPVNTGLILNTREQGPSRSAGALVNDVIIISYLQDGCPKWHPCSRVVFTAREHGYCVPAFSSRHIW